MKNERYYFYKAYGLAIKSEIKFSELFALDSESDSFDIHISVGKVPEKQSIIGFQKPISAYNDYQYWQEIPAIGRYFVANGKEIIIEPITKNWDDVRLFLITNIFYPLLFQRNQLPLLASGIINKNGEAVLFSAPFLTGKTTLLLQFLKKGYLPYTDQGCTFEIENKEKIQLNPSFPLIVCLKESVFNLGLNKTLKYNELRANINKLGILFSGNYFSNSIQLKAIVILKETSVSSTLNISKLNPQEAFMALHECHPRPEWIDKQHKNIENFKLLSSLSKQISVYKAERPYQKETNDTFVNMIEREIFL
ncbi:MAG: hypothetical protein V4683_08980 [Bacteroidota bacterium]